MKKEIALIVVMSSISMMNAMDLDLAQKKQNSTVPTMKQRAVFCCIRTYSVPPCNTCFARGILNDDLPQEKKLSDEAKTASRPSEWKHLP